eukprot:328235_1
MAQLKKEEKSNDSGAKYEPTIESQEKLTKEDLELMEKVKKKYGDKLTPLYPEVVRTFITGYRHCAEREKETYERIDHYLKRFNDYKFDTILNEPMENEEAMFKAWKLYTYGYDKQGHPVLYDEIGSAVIQEVEDTFKNDIELLRKYRYRFHRRMANCKRIQSDKLNTTLFKHSFVMDLQGFSRYHFGSNYRTIVREVIGDEQNVFPETLYVLFLINAPWAFRFIWKILGTFIDPITYQKIKVLGYDNYLEEMTKYIDIDQIPPKFKGKGKIPIKLGHCSDLPHDRYPLDYYEQLKKKSNKGADNDEKDQK